MATLKLRSCGRTIQAGLFLLFILLIPGPLVFAQQEEQPRTGSAIVIARTPQEIVIGADSRRVIIRNRPPSDNICKIVLFQNLFFASTKMIEEHESGFSLRVIIYDVLKQKGTIFEKARAFEKRISEELPKALTKVKREDPGYYKTELEGRTAFSTVFFGIENGTPTFSAIDVSVITAKEAVSVKVAKLNCPGPRCAQPLTYVLLGRQEVASRFISKHPDYWKNGLGTAINKLVQMEIDAKHDDLNGPIDILRLTASGAQWVQRQKGCIDVGSYVPSQATPTSMPVKPKD